MCGFFFIKKKTPQKFDIKKLNDSADLLAHRGPDGSKTFSNNDIFVKFYSRWCPPRLIGSDVCPRSKIRFHVTTGKTKVYEIINYG